MGALAPVSPWMPEDDLLLKNAVEAGASLESLAKGAVQFSRRFTVRELQDRWYSLLYDPVVSAEAAFRMNEFEHSASTIPSKFIRAGNSKENKCVSGKRKAESVRSCYHALRKRICNEPFNSMDLSFLVTPNDNDYVGDEYEHLSGQCLLGDPLSNQFVLQESSLDIMHHSFPQSVDGGAAHTLDTQFQNTVQEDYPMEHDNIHEDAPHILGDISSHIENRSVVEESSQPKELPVNDDPVHGCSKFDGNDALSWPVSECDSPFHNLEYASPLPEMPIWRMDESISVPCIPDNLGPCEKDMCPGDTFPILAGGPCIKNACPTEYDDVDKDSELKIEISSDEPQNATHSTEDFLAELSNYLSNDEEEPRVDVDGKALIDQSYYECLNTILLCSPNNLNQNSMLNVSGQESSITSHCLQNHSGACHGDLWENRESQYSVETVCDSEIQLLSSASALDPHPEVKDGIICCVLNTEDTEIPCNDHIVFPTHWHPRSASQEAQRSSQDAGKQNYLSSKELPSNQKPSGSPVMSQSNLENTEQSRTSSQIARSQVMPEASLLPPVGDHSIKLELPGNNSSHKSVGFACGGSTQFDSANGGLETLVSDKLKEETTETALAKHLSHNSAVSVLEKPACGSDCYKHSQTNACAVKQVEDAPARIQNHQALHAKLGSIDIAASKQSENHSTSYPAEPPKESDADVPYFSDVEAMILDMDLDPEDQDLCCSEEVSRYKHEDTKRTIMRLEQGAHSYMQRAIASHGAFAVIYGRHSKHYIRKSEVLLGRATEEVVVDIDLGREGRANKISRRQATINLDKSGSFSLKNLGKCAISVNDKEIAPGQRMSLTSSCLIEIRGMPFIFETNQTCVKRYLDSIDQNNQTQEQL